MRPFVLVALWWHFCRRRARYKSSGADGVRLSASHPLSAAIGKVEIERLKETKFDGTRSGKNFTVDRQIEPLVMGSGISGLDDRHAFLK